MSSEGRAMFEAAPEPSAIADDLLVPLAAEPVVGDGPVMEPTPTLLDPPSAIDALLLEPQPASAATEEPAPASGALDPSLAVDPSPSPDRVAQRIDSYKRAADFANGPQASQPAPRADPWTQFEPDDRFEKLVKQVVQIQPFQLALRQAVTQSLIDAMGQARIDEVRALQDRMVRTVEVVAQSLDSVEYSEARLKFHENFSTFARNLQFDGTEHYPQTDEDFRIRIATFLEKDRDNRTLTSMLASVDLVACMFCFYVANHFRRTGDLFGAFAFYVVLMFLAVPFVYLPLRALRRARWNRAMKAKFDRIHDARMTQLRNATAAAESAKESAERATAQLANDARLIGPHYLRTLWPEVATSVLWKFVSLQQEDVPRRYRIHTGDVSDEVLGGAIGKLDGLPQQLLSNFPVTVGLRDLKPEVG